MKRITAEMLEAADACEMDLATFKREWPNGCDVTVENAARAYELDLEIDFVEDMLDPDVWSEHYFPAYLASKRQVQSDFEAECKRLGIDPDEREALRLHVRHFDAHQVRMYTKLVEVINEHGFAEDLQERYSEDDGDAKFEQEGDR